MRGVEVAVVEVLLEDLPVYRKQQAAGDPPRLDAVLGEPRIAPLRILRAERDHIAHQRRVNELGHEHAPRAVPPEEVRHIDLLAANGPSHPADG